MGVGLGLGVGVGVGGLGLGLGVGVGVGLGGRVIGWNLRVHIPCGFGCVAKGHSNPVGVWNRTACCVGIFFCF